MKLLLVLLGVTSGLGYVTFQQCGYEGWSCSQNNRDYEVTYTCENHESNILIWDEINLPHESSVLIVRDCKYLEVRFFCIISERVLYTTVHKFIIINVTNLNFSLTEGKFLNHYNSVSCKVFHYINISDVRSMNFYPKPLDKNIPNCYSSDEFLSLVFNNVYFDSLATNLFFNQNLSTLEMRNVIIKEINSNALTVAGNATFVGTTFPLIPSNAIMLKGEKISFVNNIFETIQTDGLTVKSKEFKFSNNYVEELKSKALNVLGNKIEITKNIFNYLETNAFQSITPGYVLFSNHYEIAFKFIYIFTENIIKTMEPSSIHLNWPNYKKICAELQFKNNVFDCSCLNFGWTSIFHGLGPKILLMKEFYDVYLLKEDNYCSNYDHCLVYAFISQIQDVCNNKTNVSMVCSSFNNSTEPGTPTSLDDATMAVSNVQKEKSEKQMFLTKQIEMTEKIIPVLSYKENQTSHLKYGGFPVWFIVIPITVLMTAISIGLFIWWYKKKKQGQVIISSYRSERGAEADNLVMINEHHNELHNTQ